jgi:hypothetical protein
MGPKDDWWVFRMRLTINWDWVLVYRKSIMEVAIQNVNWNGPEPPSSSKHGASRNNQTARNSVRTEQKNLDQDSRFVCVPVPFKKVTDHKEQQQL